MSALLRAMPRDADGDDVAAWFEGALAIVIEQILIVAGAFKNIVESVDAIHPDIELGVGANGHLESEGSGAV
ncbi:MAG: hypothetical protein FJW31_29425, partial [Acidobacteria bacterium]|nr:hypothetical protein [Acidobacteriota bacterium]